ncbi:E3 SUMO-protein ligase NSE2 [Huso huso]|uniref:E3 SUMO-protein ligase NSE2 n=1 Tax=Huso huso TaxID=61971 RepID=A0ABR1A0W0_HUSHU|nr:E3 SUMO-protein ligase NSE2 isoform X2 [Acipenser ruthenus]
MSGMVVSFSAVNSSLSSLKMCQTYISTGMEIVTNVALDLTETEGDLDDVNTLEQMMLEYAAIDREVNHFIQAVEQVTHQIRHEDPEKISELKALVQEKFNGLQNTAQDSDLRRNEKYIQFKENLQEARKQGGLQSPEGNEKENENEMDDDIAVTQSQRNTICPITQLEMVSPMKNKKCNHSYDEQAILGLIKSRHNQRKKARCPVVGCDNADIKQSDLVPDTTLKRAIEGRKKQGSSRLTM